MGTKQDVVEQKKILEAELCMIYKQCEGEDNLQNTLTLSMIYNEISELKSQKNAWQDRLDKANCRIDNLLLQGEKIKSTAEDRILKAIGNQRWFFLKNYPKILIDKETGYLWPNLEYKDVDEYEDELDVFELSGIGDWELPSREDAIALLDDRTFPFIVGSERNLEVNGEQYNEMAVGPSAIWLDNDYPDTASYSSLRLPVNKAFADSDYSDQVKATRVFSEGERLKMVLDYFIVNGFEPVFEDDEITNLFYKKYVRMNGLLEKLGQLDQQLLGMEEEGGMIALVDVGSVLAGYNVEGVDQSVIRYYVAVKDLCSDLLVLIGRYETDYKEAIRAINEIRLAGALKYNTKPFMSEEENGIFENRQRFIANHFAFGLDTVKDRIGKVLDNVGIFERKLEAINCGEDMIHGLIALEQEERAGFVMLVENLVQQVNFGLENLAYFSKNREIVVGLIDQHKNWCQAYESFKTKLQALFSDDCEDDGIESDQWQAWYKDWRERRQLVEASFLPLIEYNFQSDLILIDKNGETEKGIEKILACLENYRDGIDACYLNERKAIHQKYAFEPNGYLQEKYEMEGVLLKPLLEFQKQFYDLVFNMEDVSDRVFAMRWADGFFDYSIDEILCFVENERLDQIAKPLLVEFAELKKSNLVSFISDAQLFGERKAEREKQFNALMFRMRKDLMKQGSNHGSHPTA